MIPSIHKDIASLLSALIIICVACAIWLTGMETVENEAGLVEAMSALALGTAFILFCLRSGAAARHAYWYGTVVLFFLVSREFDFDKLLFRQGVLSLKHYTGQAPIWQKAVGFLIVLTLLSALGTLARYGVPRLIRGALAGQVWAWLILLSGGLVIVGKTLDGLARKLAVFGHRLSVSGHDLAQYLEELAELGAALCLLLAVVRVPLQHAPNHHISLRGDQKMSSMQAAAPPSTPLHER